MKKFIYIFAFIFISNFASSQVWIEGFALYSMPVQDIFASGERTDLFTGYEPFTYQNKDLFRVYADPQFGGGINLRYASDRLIVGIELSYVDYQPATEILRINMFRIGPMVEYYFLPQSKFHPYIGGEVSLNNAKAFFNADAVNSPQISDTRFGIGGRTGFVYLFNEKTAVRFGAKYAYLNELPYVDLTLGIAFNLGDF